MWSMEICRQRDPFTRLPLLEGFFLSVLFFFIPVQCQSFARHLQNTSEQLFTAEMKVPVMAFFLRAPWEAAGFPQQQNNNKKPSTKIQMREKPWAYSPGAEIFLCLQKELMLSSGKFCHTALRIRMCGRKLSELGLISNFISSQSGTWFRMQLNLNWWRRKSLLFPHPKVKVWIVWI